MPKEHQQQQTHRRTANCENQSNTSRCRKHFPINRRSHTLMRLTLLNRTLNGSARPYKILLQMLWFIPWALSISRKVTYRVPLGILCVHFFVFAPSMQWIYTFFFMQGLENVLLSCYFEHSHYICYGIFRIFVLIYTNTYDNFIGQSLVGFFFFTSNNIFIYIIWAAIANT